MPASASTTLRRPPTAFTCCRRAAVDVTGVATYEVFLKGTLDKIGTQADFEKIGDYKTAPNQLTQTTFTPAHREMTESLTRDMYDQLVRGIAEARRKHVEEVRTLIDQGPLLAEQALKAGLVDTLAYEDQLDDHGAVSKSGTIEGERYSRARRSLAAARRPACGSRLHHRRHQLR